MRTNRYSKLFCQEIMGKNRKISLSQQVQIILKQLISASFAFLFLLVLFGLTAKVQPALANPVGGGCTGGTWGGYIDSNHLVADSVKSCVYQFNNQADPVDSTGNPLGNIFSTDAYHNPGFVEIYAPTPSAINGVLDVKCTATEYLYDVTVGYGGEIKGPSFNCETLLTKYTPSKTWYAPVAYFPPRANHSVYTFICSQISINGVHYSRGCSSTLPNYLFRSPYMTTAVGGDTLTSNSGATLKTTIYYDQTHNTITPRVTIYSPGTVPPTDTCHFTLSLVDITHGTFIYTRHKDVYNCQNTDFLPGLSINMSNYPGDRFQARGAFSITGADAKSLSGTSMTEYGHYWRGGN